MKEENVEMHKFDPEIGTSKIEGNITREVPRQK